jgi:CBS domain containing-hemolysin-like protein
MGGGTFFIALAVGYSSQVFLEKIISIIFSFTLLLLIILTGIVFDIIGVAAAAAIEAPLHARAAKKVPGARQALNLLRNADRVASLATDVVGDICGTLSGAIGAVIILRLAGRDGAEDLVMSTVMMAAVSALTVGGKALGKGFALREANEIIFFAGRILYGIERITGWRPFNNTPQKGRRP